MVSSLFAVLPETYDLQLLYFYVLRRMGIEGLPSKPKKVIKTAISKI